MLAIQRYTAMGALDTAFWVYRRYFTLLFTLSVLVALPNAVVGAAMAVKTRPEAMKSDPFAFLPLFIVVLAVGVVGGTFVTAASTRVASRVALGKTPTLGAALSETLPVFGRVLKAALLTTLAAMGYMLLLVVAGGIVGFGLSLTRSLALSIAFGVLLGVAATVLMIRLWLRWMLVVPIATLEPLGARDCMKRSRELMQGRRGKAFKVLLLFFLVALVIQGGLMALTALLPGETFGSELVKQLLLGTSSALISPVMYVVVALLYYDARVDLEAFDVEMLARQSTAPQSA